jgi:hypothetical protein
MTFLTRGGDSMFKWPDVHAVSVLRGAERKVTREEMQAALDQYYGRDQIDTTVHESNSYSSIELMNDITEAYKEEMKKHIRPAEEE